MTESYQIAGKIIRKKAVETIRGFIDVAVSYGVITFMIRTDAVSDVLIWKLRQLVLDVAGIETGRAEVAAWGDGIYAVSLYYSADPIVSG